MRAIAHLLAGLIRGYQLFISPFLPPSCGFEPTCSHYARSALLRHGPLIGSALTLWRILRCNPFTGGGYDPVPEAPLRLRRSAQRAAE